MTAIDRIRVISLDRTPERYRRFVDLNAHLAIERFCAIDGQSLNRWDIVDEGLITPGNPYNLAQLGAAVSHLRLWQRCHAEGRALHIAEDDAIFRHDFMATASAMLSALPGWDIVLWSWNFDWPMEVKLGSGLGPAVLTCNEESLRAQWAAFQASTPTPSMLPLITGAGTCAYSLSPEGAKKLLQRSLPIAGRPGLCPGQTQAVVLNRTLDIEMTRHYASLQAFIAVPCLAISLNLKSETTIWTKAN